MRIPYGPKGGRDQGRRTSGLEFLGPVELGKKHSAGWVEVSISEDQIIDLLTQQIVIENLEHTCAVVGAGVK